MIIKRPLEKLEVMTVTNRTIVWLMDNIGSKVTNFAAIRPNSIFSSKFWAREQHWVDIEQSYFEMTGDKRIHDRICFTVGNGWRVAYTTEFTMEHELTTTRYDYLWVEMEDELLALQMKLASW